MWTVVKSKTIGNHNAKTYSQIKEYKGIMFISFKTWILYPIDEYQFNSMEQVVKKTSNYVVSCNSYAIKIDTFNEIMRDFAHN